MTATELWARGLASAFIGGGASAVTAAFSANVIAPDKFNTSDHLANFVKLAFATFFINGVMSAFFYLKQSPLPTQPPETAQPKE